MRNELKALIRFCKKQNHIRIERRKLNSILDADSYFPEMDRKPRNQRRRELEKWLKQYVEANKFYNLYGFDTVGKQFDEYIDNESFILNRNVMNHVGGLFPQVVLLRDKMMFYQYLSILGISTPKVFGIVKDNSIFNTTFQLIDMETIKSEKDYFVKSIDGECASFVKHINDFDEFKSVMKNKPGQYILQNRVYQSVKMNELNPYAVNTLRIVTVYNNGEPFVLSMLLRIGTKDTCGVDNWAVGGLACGITDDGHLKPYAFYKPGFGSKVNIHPDTGVVFSEFQIPFLYEAKEMACAAHRAFYNIETIGWDVAILDDGPTFIEGNDNWEISLMQCCDRPLKKDWIELVNKYNSQHTKL